MQLKTLIILMEVKYLKLQEGLGTKIIIMIMKAIKSIELLMTNLM